MQQQIAVSEKLNPNRITCEPFGIKARSKLNRITLTPSEASPNETLYVDIPKLAENIIIVNNNNNNNNNSNNNNKHLLALL